MASLQESLQSLSTKYKTDKGTEHSYLSIYEKELAEFRNASVNVLEVGVLFGESLKMFHEYFTCASIYGMDNFTQLGFVPELPIGFPRISILNADSTAEISNSPMFHVIIDDGDHMPDVQFKTFVNLVKYLHDDGIYFIEDIVGFREAGCIKMAIENTYGEGVFVIEPHFLHKNWRHDDIIMIIKKKMKQTTKRKESIHTHTQRIL